MHLYSALAIVFGAIHVDGAQCQESAQRLIKSEQRRLEGIWHAVRGTEDGEENPVPKEGVRFIITSGKYRMLLGEKVTDEGSLSIDPFKNPKAIEITRTGNGKTGLGIYQFKNDELWMCMAPPDGSARPEDFSCKKGSNHLLMIWKRSASSVKKETTDNGN